MRTMIMILAISLASIAPGLAIAKKPQPSPTPECVILVSGPLVPTLTYAVKVVRDPAYTGAWRNPMISIQASYPGSMQTVSAEIEPSLSSVFSVTYVNASLLVPGDATSGEYATISATVREPLKKRNTYRETQCSTTAYIE